MIRKYCFNTKKRISLSQLVSYIFLFFTMTFVAMSILGCTVKLYNQYYFNRRVGSEYGYLSGYADKNFEATVFCLSSLFSHYDSELSTENAPYYRNDSQADLYITSEEKMEHGFFTYNILEYNEKLAHSRKENTYPILLSYSSFYDLDVEMGDYIDLLFYGTKVCTFRICGCLAPYYAEFSASHMRPALAITDLAVNEQLVLRYVEKDSYAVISGKISYLSYSNERPSDDLLFYSRWEEQATLESQVRLNGMHILVTVLAGIGILVMVSGAETRFVWKRNSRNFYTMKCLGMSNKKILAAVFLIVSTEYILSIAAAAAFTALWVKNVWYEYCSTNLLVILFLTEIFVACTASYLYSYVRCRKNGLY